MLRRLSSKKDPTQKQILKKFHEFLDSSIWTLPIATFIEQRSIVFDRNHAVDCQEEYQTTHSEYAGLVDTLVECFCGDADIPVKNLQEAIATLDREKMNVRQRMNLEPVAAAHDFDVFVPMMMRKNVELQLQALQMIEFMCGLIPNVLQLEDGETLKDKKVLSPEETERYVLIAVMRQSKEEFDRANAVELREDLEKLARSGEDERRRLTDSRDREELLVETAMNRNQMEVVPSDQVRPPTAAIPRPPTSSTSFTSPIVNSSSDMPRPPSSKVISSQPVSLKIEKAVDEPGKMTTDIKRRSSTPVGKRPATSEVPDKSEKLEKTSASGTEATPIRKASAGREKSQDRKQLKDVRRPSLPAKPKTPSVPRSESPGAEHGPRRRNVNDVHALLQEQNRLNTADVEERKRYLEKQRDKLLAMKHEERQKQMQEVSTRAAQERPRTAKAARGAMRGANTHDEVMAARRLLAEKLKNEVG